MQVKAKLRFVSNELKMSKQGNTYRIVTFIDQEADKIVARADIAEEVQFDSLTPVEVTLNIKIDRYINVKLIDIKPL